MRSRRFGRFAAVTLAAVATAAGMTMAAAPAAAPSASASPPYPCAATGGPNADAAAIGWLGNAQGATACLGGSFYVPNGINTEYGFGVYNYTRTTWTNSGGYLPALVTSFTDDGAQVSITNFGDEVTIGGHRYVAIYSRVAVRNPTGQPVTIDPQPTPGLVPLNSASDQVAPGATVNHDYVVAEDRFGGTYAWPTASQLAAAGGYDAHFAHMKAFWDGQLAQIAQLTLPDAAAGRRVEGRLHLHPDRPQRQRPGHRHQRVPPGVRARRHRHPGQPLQRGLLHRRARAARRGRPRGRHEHPVLRRHLGLPVAVGGVRREDRRHQVPRQPLRQAGPARGHEPAEHRDGRARDRRRPHRAGRDHRRDQRHRRQRLLDVRQLRGPARPGRLRVPRQGRRRQDRGQLGRPRSTTACSRP